MLMKNWHMNQEVLLAANGEGAALITITGTGGDYDTIIHGESPPSAQIKYVDTPQGYCARAEDNDDPNECECAKGLSTKCKENFCSVSGDHCDQILATPDESFTQDAADFTCTPPAAPTGCGWISSNSWLPPGYAANLKAWCDLYMESKYDDEPLYRCLVGQVQIGVNGMDAATKATASSIVASHDQWNDEDLAEM